MNLVCPICHAPFLNRLSLDSHQLSCSAEARPKKKQRRRYRSEKKQETKQKKQNKAEKKLRTAAPSPPSVHPTAPLDPPSDPPSEKKLESKQKELKEKLPTVDPSHPSDSNPPQDPPSAPPSHSSLPSDPPDPHSPDPPSPSAPADPADPPVDPDPPSPDSDLQSTQPEAPASPVDVDLCAICQERTQSTENLSTLTCKHVFHTDCVLPWLLDRESTCPNCRIPIINLNGEPIPERKQPVAQGYDDLFDIPPSPSALPDIPQELLLPNSEPAASAADSNSSENKIINLLDPPSSNPVRDTSDPRTLPDINSTHLPDGLDSRTLRSGTSSTTGNNFLCPVLECHFSARDLKVSLSI